MKRFFLTTLLIHAGASIAWGATSPIFINNSPTTTAPQVDATVFWNRSTISIFTTFPFQAQNVQFWTNTAIMSGSPGFLFEYDLSGQRARRVRANSRNLQRPSDVFFNSGQVSGGNVLNVRAKNIVNSGRLDGSEFGIIKMLATNGAANLSRSTMRTGPSSLFPVCDFLPFSTNFTPDVHITDIYWGAGRNNALGTNGRPLDLTTAASFFRPSDPSFTNFSLGPTTPSHQVRVRGINGTNTVSLPGFLGFAPITTCAGLYDVFVHTNFITTTSILVNVVFVPTNNLAEPTNLSVAVRFTPTIDTADGFVFAPIVEFQSFDFDIVEQQSVTNYVTFMDTSAAETNIVLARPFLTTSGTSSAARRPNTYNIIQGRFCNFDFSETANGQYDPGMFYNPNFRTNIVNTIYAGYGAQVGVSNLSAFATPTTILTPIFTGSLLGANPAVSDPSNFTGRVEIDAGNLDLSLARIRAENFVGIKADNLKSNLFAQVDAPFVDFQVQSTNAELVIQNLAPPSVNRLAGTFAAWSSVWNVPVTNFVFDPITGLPTATNLITMRFHVLVVDDCLRSTQPVTLNRFSVRAPSLVIRDNVLVNRSASIKTRALTVASNATLALPLGSDLAFTNVNDLVNFTNDGIVSVQGAAYFGTFDAGHIPAPPPRRQRRKKPQPPFPLDNFVNHGAFGSSALFVRATNAEFSNPLFTPLSVDVLSGPVFVNASSVTLSNLNISAGTDVELHANDLLVTLTSISAGSLALSTNTDGSIRVVQAVRGALVLDATNSFGDFGPATSNSWLVTGGVKVPTRPANPGDLMATRIYSTGAPFWQSDIVWAGEDRGPFVEGYVNNLALGRLTLDGAVGNLFHFQSPGGSNALYVDYLELLNSATNFNFAVGVDEDFTLYFGDSNVPPEKLDETGGGRIRWVSQFAGPQSGTNITYPNGITYRFNAGLVRSRDLDSDGDGIVNAEDCTPIPVAGVDTTGCSATDRAKSGKSSQDIGLTIGVAAGGVILSWEAAAGSANAVEFSDAVAGGTWQSLTNFINGPVNARVTVKDAAGGPLRVYRVRVDAGKP